MPNQDQGQNPQQGPNQLPTEEQVESSFRDSLPDVIAMVIGLAPLFTDIDEMVAAMELGMKNDGQLRMLMRQVTPVRLRR